MNRLSIIVAVALLAAAQPHAQQTNQALDKLFASAQHKAAVEGHLQAAIEDYKRIVATSGRDRSAAAQALLRMAEAYEKLGDAEAQRIYERLTRDYQDQKEAVSVAHTRLASAADGKRILRTERVLMLGRPHDRISPDGRYLARPNSATGNLDLVDLRTGATRALTSDGTSTDPGHQFPLASTFSRDGKQIAYQWYIEDENRDVLRVISTAPGSPNRPRVIYDNRDVSFAPTDWSPDGKWVAGVVRRSDRTSQIAVIGVDGSFRPLRTVEWSRVGGVRFSPDSSRLAFHMPAAEGGFARDVYVVTLHGSPKQTVVASSAGDDLLLEWMLDGRSLLVASDRGGTMSAWKVPADGSGGSQYELIKSDIGVVSSLGPTTNGTVFYHLMPGASNVYVANFDFAKGQLSSQPRSPIKQFRGTTGLAQWSNDGRFIVHESWRDIPAPINVTRPVIAFVSLETGEVVREVPFAVSYGTMGALSPDGGTFIARGADLKGRSGALKVDATTGAATIVSTGETCGAFPIWARDGASFYCSAGSLLYQVDVASGQVLRTLRTDEQVHAVSPDGRYVITGGDSGGLKAMTIATGEKRVLVSISPPDYFFDLTGFEWTPDGRSFVVYGKIKGEEGLWLVPIEGGAPHRIQLDKGLISSWRFNPNNDQVVFTIGPGRWSLEVWKLDIPSSVTATSAKGQ